MGDLVLGVAKTVVEGTLVRAKSAIDEEAKRRQSVQRDLVFISGEFEMMQCFLNITDEERAKNAVVKTWVRQIRDLAYDVEDCIEFVVHLDNKPTWWWRVVPSCMAPQLSLDKAADNITELKARVQDVSQRNMRYNLINDSGSKPLVAQPHLAIAGAAEFDMLAQAKDAAKKQHVLWNLTDLINRQDRDLQVISLWGTGGDLGMTSIVRKAYVDPDIRRNFTWRAWVKITHPFNPDEFIRSFLAQLHARSRQEQRPILGVDVVKKMKTEAVPKDDLADEFVRQISEHRYLVVLEGLSSMVDWDAARAYLPDTKNGSRIIVSTQHFEIASLCTGHPNQISEIREFSPDHSVCILFKEGSHRDGDKYHNEVGHSENFHPFESEAAQILDILKRVDSEIRGDNKNSLAFQVMSVWGISGDGKSALVSRIYHGQMEPKYIHRWGKYAWVDVPHPFSLRAFYRSLLWELCSITTEAEEMESYDSCWYLTVEEACRHMLRQHRCLFVINGLESIEQWDLINTALELGEAEGSSTIVVTNTASLATHCVDNASLVCNVKTSKHDNDQDPQHNRGKHEDEMTHSVAPTPGDNFHLVGRQFDMRLLASDFNLIDYEISDQVVGHQIMAVWGIAGVGKSALVRSFYCNQMKPMYSHRWSKHGWVNVTRPFNLREFSWRLFLDLSSKSTNGNGKANEYFGMSSIEDPIKECRDILHAHRCFIVIDDLQSIEEWDSINTALGLGSAKIRAIIITNEASVAIHCADSITSVNIVNSLESDAALQLFKDQLKLPPMVTYEEHSTVMEQVGPILTKCGGLPIVILAVCHYIARGMSTQDRDAELLLKLLNVKFIPELEGSSYGLKGLFVWMHSYFRSCPDFLKPCVFYLPIFPPNYSIRRRRLLRRWIAEGYSRDTVDATSRQNGERSFLKLVNLSMIQQLPIEKIDFTRNALCNVNGFFREYIVSQPMEDNMVFALDEHCSQNSQNTGRHLVIRSSWDRDRYVFESIDFSRLRSLTVFGKWEPFFISELMKVLRVLDLEDTSGVTDDDLEQIVKLLSCLKFLSLRGITSVSCLPDSLGNLKQLETLDVRHTSVAMLPPTIINLQKLQYIRAGTTAARVEEPSAQERSEGCWLPNKFRQRRFMSSRLGVKVPRGIGKLMALRTLGVVNVGAKRSNSILKEVKNLTQVRKLGVSGVNRENIQDFYSAILAQGHLESLSVRLDKDSQDFFCCRDDISEPLKKNLRSLKLYGLVCKLPAWINQFSNLTKLDLEMTVLTQEMIDSLPSQGQLVRLRLCVKPIQDVEVNISFQSQIDCYFDFIRSIEIDCSSRLQLAFEQTTVYVLRLLKVHCSGGSKISGIAHLVKLKEVRIIGSCDVALKQDLERQLAEHPSEPKPVLVMEEVSSC